MDSLLWGTYNDDMGPIISDEKPILIAESSITFISLSNLSGERGRVVS